MTSSSAARFAVRRQVRNAAAVHVHLGAAQALRRHVLAGHRLDHVGAGQEHRTAVGHDDEVGQRRRVDGAAGAGPEDQRDLRDHARGHHVAHEHLAVRGEAAHAFLDAGAPRVVEPDQRDAGLERQVLDAADLVRLHLRERPAEHREVLREHRDAPPADLAEARDQAVAEKALVGEPELRNVVRRQRAELLERALVQQQCQALAGGELAPRVLLLDPLPAPAQHRAPAHFAQRRQMVVPGVVGHCFLSPRLSGTTRSIDRSPAAVIRSRSNNPQSGAPCGHPRAARSRIMCGVLTRRGGPAGR